MGQGVAQKRRLKNFLKAKETKSGRLTMLPPPPEEVAKKGRRQPATSDMPRSLQRMLQLKASVEKRAKRGGKKGPPAEVKSEMKVDLQQEAASGAEPLGADVDLLGEADRPLPGIAAAEIEPSSSGQLEPEHTEAPAESQVRKHNSVQQSGLDTQPAAVGKGMKERKKEFLKKRKLKKKGGRQAKEEELEAQLAQDPHKPRFGEQAMAPIKVNLKRKHWDPNASQGRSSKRCTHIFEQQMANAKQQGGSHKNVLPASTAQRSEQQGGKAKGKKALKPWQLKKEKLSQKATQGAVQASAIEAYRSLKRSQDKGNGATLQSLKELVKRDADRSAQQAAS